MLYKDKQKSGQVNVVTTKQDSLSLLKINQIKGNSWLPLIGLNIVYRHKYVILHTNKSLFLLFTMTWKNSGEDLSGFCDVSCCSALSLCKNVTGNTNALLPNTVGKEHLLQMFGLR